MHHFKEITNAGFHRKVCVCPKDTYGVAMIRNYQDVHFQPPMSTYCEKVISRWCITIMKCGLQLLQSRKPPPGIDVRITPPNSVVFHCYLESVTLCLISHGAGHFLQVFTGKIRCCTLWPQLDHKGMVSVNLWESCLFRWTEGISPCSIAVHHFNHPL